MARVVINPKSTGTIRFASAEAGLAAAPMFEEQISNFRVQASQNLADIPATYAAPAAQSAAASSWAITFEYLQDWGKTDGLSKFLYDNDGVLMWFQHNPAGTTAGTPDTFTGQCYVVAGAHGGAADENWVDSLTMPCPSKPVRSNAA
jgi:hypothetical protein